MEILILETNEIISEAEFRVRHENVSFPEILRTEDLESNGAAIVLASPQPATTDFQSVLRDGAVKDALGNYVQAWKVIDWPQEQIDAAIASAKEAKNAQINQWRLEANRSSFTFAGKSIACDELSRSDIDATNGRVATRGALPANWPGGWKTVDNSYVAIPDVATWNTFYDAMVEQGTGNFNKAQQLKQALAAATTLSEINAIVW